MAQAITIQPKAMIAHAEQEGAPMKKPPTSTNACRLKDFKGMTAPIFKESTTSEDSQEFVDDVHEILVAMGGQR